MIKFQSPQWGSNSKGSTTIPLEGSTSFQSPQWGSNSKVGGRDVQYELLSFSPRNGEVILKTNTLRTKKYWFTVSVPAMGK